MQLKRIRFNQARKELNIPCIYHHLNRYKLEQSYQIAINHIAELRGIELAQAHEVVQARSVSRVRGSQSRKGLSKDE